VDDTTTNFVKLISSIDIFSDLDMVTRKDIAAQFKIQRFSPGDLLIESGKMADRFFIILSGSVELRSSDLIALDQRQVKLASGSVLGEIALLTKTPYQSNAEALEKTIAVYLDVEAFTKLLQKHKSFATAMTNLISNRMALDGGLNQVGRYTLTEKIGEGNMAKVFEGYDPMLERHVALKMLKYDLANDEDFLRRFDQEAKVIAKLNHPNIVNVYETVRQYSTSFIVMERLRGKDLNQILREQGPLSVEHTREVLYQVICALEYAHTLDGEGIIHRDIKPANIFIDDTWGVKLTDFGVAKPPTDVITTLMGTPKYLAPEIIRGEPFDGGADIYAVGIMAFTMLTGKPPFSANSLNELLAMQVYESHPDIKSYRKDVDEDLTHFIDSALIKERSERISDWATIKDLLKPGKNRQLPRTNRNQVAFVAHLQNSSNQQTEKIIKQLKEMLEQEGIEHKIEMLK
jgi:CRP-like cAMP-binding protein